MAKKIKAKDILSLESVLWNCRAAPEKGTEKNRDAVA